MDKLTSQELVAGLPHPLWFHTQCVRSVGFFVDGTLGTSPLIVGTFLTECVVLGNLVLVVLQLSMALES